MKTFNRILFVLLLLTSFSSAYAQNYYGAVYINKTTGIAGGAYDAANLQQAQKEAYGSCVQKNKGKSGECIFANNVKNGCLAIAWAPNTKIGTSNWGTPIGKIERSVMNGCKKSGGEGCQLKLSFCTSRVVYY